MLSQRQQSPDRALREPGQARCIEAKHDIAAIGELSDLLQRPRAHAMVPRVTAGKGDVNMALAVAILVHHRIMRRKE